MSSKRYHNDLKTDATIRLLQQDTHEVLYQSYLLDSKINRRPRCSSVCPPIPLRTSLQIPRELEEVRVITCFVTRKFSVSQPRDGLGRRLRDSQSSVRISVCTLTVVGFHIHPHRVEAITSDPERCLSEVKAHLSFWDCRSATVLTSRRRTVAIAHDAALELIESPTERIAPASSFRRAGMNPSIASETQSDTRSRRAIYIREFPPPAIIDNFAKFPEITAI
ncbi:hypothetical protein BV25DRAFT_1438502 [Artomyces pyxidatus]|uniref:Uncharacterized protein n=1 Tax=Artomyces pyxidatus TaxID=48021 RepID=A0ACB8SLQ9_9AGAM|nr:hypothetical protein BV25DRAFT_1438502 [Artomyces pyxidatus]